MRMRHIYFKKDVLYGWSHCFYDLQVVIEVEAKIFVQHNSKVLVLISILDKTSHHFKFQYLRGRFIQSWRLLFSNDFEFEFAVMLPKL